MFSTMVLLSPDFYPNIFSPRPYNRAERIMFALGCSCGRANCQTQQQRRADCFSYVVSTDGVHVCHPESIIEYGDDEQDEQDGPESSSQALVEFEPIEAPESIIQYGDDERDALESSSQALVEFESIEASITGQKPTPNSLLKRRGRLLPALHLSPSPSIGSTLLDSLNYQGDVRNVTARPHHKNPECEPIKRIGVDGEGVIDLVKHRTAPCLVVRKTVKYARWAHGKPIEATILQDILPSDHHHHHNNIIRLDAFEPYQLEGARYYFEYCAGGDLHQLVDQYRNHAVLLPEPFIWQTYQKLASALEFLHRGFDPRCPDRDRRGVCHRDIKPSNIFLRVDPSNNSNPAYPDVVLADFGHATLNFATYDPAGTSLWQPPELPRHSPKGDVYSLGAVVHFLIHFQAPIAEMPDDLSDTESMRDMWAEAPETRRPIAEFVEGYSEELICMMLLPLQPDENRRKNSSQLLRYVDECVKMKYPDSLLKAEEEWPIASWAFDHILSEHGRCDHDDGGEVEKEDEDEEEGGKGTTQYFEMMKTFGCCVSRQSSGSSSPA